MVLFVVQFAVGHLLLVNCLQYLCTAADGWLGERLAVAKLVEDT